MAWNRVDAVELVRSCQILDTLKTEPTDFPANWGVKDTEVMNTSKVFGLGNWKDRSTIYKGKADQRKSRQRQKLVHFWLFEFKMPISIQAEMSYVELDQHAWPPGERISLRTGARQGSAWGRF